MTQAIREHVTVEREGVIEIHHPGLSLGARAEVIVLVDKPVEEPPSLLSFVGKGKGCFSSAAEVDAFIRSERDAWDR